MNNRQWLVMGALGLSMAVLGGCASHNGSSESAAAPVSPISQPVSQAPATHVVQPGDTLYGIARKTGIDWKTIASLNGIQPPYTIRVGQVLKLGQQSQSAVAVVAPVVTPVVLEQPVVTTPVQPVVAPVVAPSSAVTAPPLSGAPAVPVAQSVNYSTLAPTQSQIMSLAAVENWRWPTEGKVIRTFNPQNPTNPNKGIDIGGQLGQPVIAAAAGEVVYAGSGLQGYGQLLLIRHSKTEVTAYGHNQRLLVQEGQTVRAGEKIAEMGSSGTDRVKLHFEVRKDGKPVDPLQLLPRS